MVQLTVIKPERTGRKPVNGFCISLLKLTGVHKYALLLAILLPILAQAQPVITSFTPLSGPVGTSIKITGTGFNATPNNNIVHLGAVRVIVDSGTTSSLYVTVPTGASYAPISVTAAGKAGKSERFFTPTFATCLSITSIGSLTSAFVQNTVLSNATSNSVSSADIDGDGKPDLVTFNNNSINIFRNTSSGSNVTFVKTALSLPAGQAAHQFYGGVVMDLDGNGLPEVVAVNNTAGTVLVYHNVSSLGTVNFQAPVLYFGFTSPMGVGAGDFDGDGKPDLAILNGTGANTVSYLKNASNIGTPVFLPSAGIPVSTGADPRHILCSDLDKDGKIDIVVSNYGLNSLSVFRNSFAGTDIAFTTQSQVPVSGGPMGIAAGDFDSNGSTDLVVVRGVSNTLAFLNNSSTTGNIVLNPSTFTPGGTATVYGKVDVGDLDGDGKPDIVVGSNADAITCFKNTSSGSISFSSTPVSISTGFAGSQPSGVCIGDFNADGQADLADVNMATGGADVYANNLTKVSVTGISPETGIPNMQIAITGSNLACVTSATIGGQPAAFAAAPTNFTLLLTTGPGATGNVVLYTNGGSVIGPKFTFVTAPKNFTYENSSDTTVKFGTSDLTRTPSIDKGGGKVDYSISLGATVGININTNTGQIGWANDLPIGDYPLEITAINTAGSTTTNIILRVIPEKPIGFVYSTSAYIENYGTPGHSVIPNIIWMGQKWTSPRTPFRIISPSSIPSGIKIDDNGVISWTDGANTPEGSYHIIVRAENDGGFADAAIDLQIKAITPVMGSYTLPARTINFREIGSVAVVANSTSWNGDSKGYVLEANPGLPTQLLFNATTGTFSWNATPPVPVGGVYTAVVRAKNNAGLSANTATFLLTVKPTVPDAPVYAPVTVSDVFGDEDSTGAPVVNDWGGMPGHFEINNAPGSLPAGISINPANGKVKWTGTVDAGTYLIRVVSVNDAGPSSEAVFTLEITPEKPAGLVYSDKTVDFASTGSINPNTPLPGWTGQDLKYKMTVTPANPGITIVESSGEVKYESTVPVDVYTIKVTAYNDAGGIDASFTLTVNPTVPTGLAYTLPNPRNINYGDGGTASVTSDLDWHGALTGRSFELVGTVLPPQIAFNTGSGTISWNSTNPVPVDNYIINVRARNGAGPGATVTFTLKVAGKASSNLTYDPLIEEGLFATADSSSAPKITWGGLKDEYKIISVVPAAAGITINKNNGKILWSATVAVGTYTIRVRTTNTENQNSNDAEVKLVIKPIPPTGLVYNDKSADFGTGGSITPANTPSWTGQALKYKMLVTPANAGIIIDELTGTITYSNTLPVRSYTIRVTAYNDNGENDAVFVLAVNPKVPTGLAYTSNPRTINYGDAGSSTVTSAINWYGDLDPANHEFELVSTGLPPQIRLDVSTGTISWTSSNPVPVGDHYLIEVRAKNRAGASLSTATFDLTVRGIASTILAYDPAIEEDVFGHADSSNAPRIKWGGLKDEFKIINPAGELPAEITINKNNGKIIWSKTLAAGTYTVRVRATNTAGNNSNEVELILKITPVLTKGLAYNDQDGTFETGGSFSYASAPEPNGLPFSYKMTVTPANASITIDASTGDITYGDHVPVGIYSFKVTAFNNGGESNANFKLTVKPGLPTGGTYTPNPRTINYRDGGSAAIADIDWHGELLNRGFELVTTGLPAQIGFSNTTGLISWTSANPVPVGNYPMEILLKNGRGSATTTVLFELRVKAIASTNLVYNPAKYEDVFGHADSSIAPKLTSGGLKDEFSIVNLGVLPGGISINPDNGKIKWDATVPAATYTIRVKATNPLNASSNEAVVTLEIKPVVLTGLDYNDKTGYFGVAGSIAKSSGPVANGLAFNYTMDVTPADPGIAINTASGEISYGAAVPVRAYTIKVTATNTNGTSNTTLTLTVKPQLPVFSYPTPVFKLAGIADSTDLPSINWMGDLSGNVFENLKITPATAGFSLSVTGSGRVLWTAAVPVGDYYITVDAKNDAGTTQAGFTLKITAQPPVILSYPVTTGTYGTAANSGTPSVNWKGDQRAKSFEYTAPLPAGFSFDATTGVISWNDKAAVGTYFIKVRAKNLTGTGADYTYTVTIKASAPDFYYDPAAGTFGTAGTASPHIDWKGGSGTFQKSDPSGTIPASIVVDPNTGVISWPDNLAIKSYSFDVKATNTNGAVVTTNFKLIITAGPASGLAYVPNQVMVTYGDKNSTLEPKIGWFGDIGSFSMLPNNVAGITIDSKTGVISWDGTTDGGIYMFTVSATNNQGTATAGFELTVVPKAPVDLFYGEKVIEKDAGNDGVSVKPTVTWNGQKLGFNFVTPVAGFTVDNDGIIHWTKDQLPGTYTVGVYAYNSKGNSNIETLSIKLVVAPPTIKYTPSSKDIEFGVVANSVKPNINWHGEKKTIGVTGVVVNSVPLPAGQTMGITVDGDGIITFPNNLAMGSSVTVFVTVSNGAGQNYDTYTVNVGKAPTNLVYSTDEYDINQNTTGRSVVPSVEWNGLEDKFVVTGAPTGVTINNDKKSLNFGQLTWTNVVPGLYKFKVYAENGVGKSNEVEIELEVYGLPTATITGGAPICTGTGRSLTITLTGASPWSVTYTANAGTPVTIDNITSSPYTLTVTPTVNTTYKLTEVRDKNTTNSGLTSSTTVTVNTAVTALINNGDAISACNGATLTLTASGAGSGGNYVWLINGVATTNTGTSLIAITNGDYTVKATNAAGCTGTSDIAKVTLNTTPSTVLNDPAYTLICEGTDLELTATGATTYKWYRDGTAIAGATAAKYAAKEAGKYTVEGFNGTCSKMATKVLTLTLAKKPVLSFSYDSYCKDNPVHFSNTSTNDGPDISYKWHFGDTKQGTSTDKAPVYTYTKAETVMILLNATSKACPTMSITQATPVVLDIEEPTPAVRYEPINALKNRPSQIEGRSFGNAYAWTPADGLNNRVISDPTVTPSQEQTYQLKITTQAGCVTVDTQLVRIFSQAEIFVPKGFTPNNDGMNDRLFPIAVGINKLNYFKVFNRWGVLMYETQDAGSRSTGGGWDGTHKGAKQPMDSYTWIAEGVDVDGHTIKISGSTVLMR